MHLIENPYPKTPSYKYTNITYTYYIECNIHLTSDTVVPWSINSLEFMLIADTVTHYDN